ncbi:hypothetical protein L208DRAFT_1411957 [Tricholoma matsutake]|nr:hypothetical protein L208DRAFT_1411957 [Tricholoma matsutake 945]
MCMRMVICSTLMSNGDSINLKRPVATLSGFALRWPMRGSNKLAKKKRRNITNGHKILRSENHR